MRCAASSWLSDRRRQTKSLPASHQFAATGQVVSYDAISLEALLEEASL